MHQPKTNQKRGGARSLIRYWAAQFDTFTIENLTPALTMTQARDGCNLLCRAGELERAESGANGHPTKHHKFTAYRRTANLRHWSETLKHKALV